MIPSSVNRVPAEVDCKTDYTSVAMKKRTLDKKIDGQRQETSACTCTSIKTVAPTQEETNSFLKNLHHTGDNAVILSIMPEYCGASDSAKVTADPSEFQMWPNGHCVATEALIFCFLNLMWQMSRIQRQRYYKSIEVSSMVCPQPGWDEYILRCYMLYVIPVWRTESIQWGSEHEETAREIYTEILRKEHLDFHVEKYGFIVNPDFPYKGSSPDGLISRSCCGQRSGCLEIKCPFKHRRSSMSDACKGKDFCLSSQVGKFLRKKKKKHTLTTGKSSATSSHQVRTTATLLCGQK